MSNIKQFTNNKPPQANIQIDVKTLDNITCECGNIFFINGFELKRLSGIVSPTGKTEIVTVQHPICTKCHKAIVLNESPPRPVISK